MMVNGTVFNQFNEMIKYSSQGQNHASLVELIKYCFIIIMQLIYCNIDQM